jgi:(1->4)-alpha-D-glucan 1-alpha-D-glucosylmutase
LSLVDPDNRRPVDFSARAAAFAALPTQLDWEELAQKWPDGRIKLALTHRLLAWRLERQALFERGGYQPLTVSGPDRDHVIAFARTLRREAAIIVAGRHFTTRTDAGRRWPDGAGWDANLHLDGFTGVRDRLRPGQAIKGQTIAIAEVFGPLSVAVLDAVHGTPEPLRR